MLIQLTHQKNRRTDFKVISDNFEEWIKNNPLGIDAAPPVIKEASINEDGEVVPINKGTGDYLQDVD